MRNREGQQRLAAPPYLPAYPHGELLSLVVAGVYYLLPTPTYASKTWAWNESQRSRVQAVEMSYLRSACGVSRMNRQSNESMYERFGVCHVGVGKKCGVVEEVKRQTLGVWPHGANLRG